MSNKNNKEKSSFWKKLVGKNKSSISSLKSETNLHYDKHDSVSIKSKKRQSGLISHPPPQPQPPTQPPTPKPTIQQQQQQQQQQQSKGTMTTPTMATVDTLISTPPIVTSAKEDLSQTKLVTEDTTKDKDSKQTQPPVQQTNQAVKNDITPKKVTGSSEEENLLRSELEKHKATILALQKQKEAVAKDLDYLELTVEELLTEKNDLIQQLEDEKIKSQHHLEESTMLLHKMKSTADNAREQSFANEQIRQELENFQLKASEEKESLLLELKQKDKSIRELKSKLNKSQDQTEALKETIEHLVKTHAEELGRVTKMNEENEKKIQSLLNTPHGSPEKDSDTRSIPVPTKKEEDYTPKESIEYDDDLDDQLMKLTKEKEKLQSYYSKIPLTGGGPKSRRRREELEAMLDQVDSQLSTVKQKIKRS